MKPQDYGARTSYRPPARWYQRLNRLGSSIVGLGLAPSDAVTLEVRGRNSAKVRRTPIVVTPHDAGEYVVSLAGESQWVRNVRAAEGHATLKRGRRRTVRLIELDVDERAPILMEYLRRGAQRSGEKAARDQARFYFGLDPGFTIRDIEEIARHYPVFRVEYA